MAATEDRVRELFHEHLGLGREPDFDVEMGDSGVSSVDAVAFVKKVGEAFGLEISPEDSAKFRSLRDVVGYIDTHGG